MEWINAFTVTKEVIGLVNALDEGQNQELEKWIDLREDVLLVVIRDMFLLIVLKEIIIYMIELENLKEVIQMRVEKKDVLTIIEDKEAILEQQEEKDKAIHSEEIEETEIEVGEEIIEAIPEEVEDQMEIIEEDKKLDGGEVHLHIKVLQHPGGKKTEDNDINKKDGIKRDEKEREMKEEVNQRVLQNIKEVTLLKDQRVRKVDLTKDLKVKKVVLDGEVVVQKIKDLEVKIKNNQNLKTYHISRKMQIILKKI